jgi:uncharacterized protein
MKKLLFVIFLSFILFSSHAFAQEYPTLTKYVNDYAGILSDTEIAQINDLCSQIEQNWTVEVAVLTINSTQPTTIEDYAVKAFEKNGIGKKDTDNGLLIVVAVQDKRWRFEVGYGLEPILNDAKTGNIGRTYLVPNFQNGQYGAGLYQAIDAIGQVIASGGDDSFISEQGPNDSEIVFIMITIIFLIMLFLTVILPAALTERCPKCGSRMNCKYDYNNNSVTCECPKCGKKVRKRRNDWAFWLFVASATGSGHGGHGGSGGGFGGGSSGGGGASGGW